MDSGSTLLPESMLSGAQKGWILRKITRGNFKASILAPKSFNRSLRIPSIQVIRLPNCQLSSRNSTSEFRNVIVSDPAKCRIYVLHNHRRQIRNGQGARSGPMARVPRTQRAAIIAGLRPAPAGRPRPSKHGADRHQCPFQVLMWGTGRWVA